MEYERFPDGSQRSRADALYGYRDALADGVVRPVMFMAYSGEAKWRSSAGDELAVRLGQPLTKDLTSQAWRTALDPAGSGSSRSSARPTAACPRYARPGYPTRPG
ncbi:hypothetical protein GCM10029992_30760 [Glycomyces albus]